MSRAIGFANTFRNILTKVFSRVSGLFQLKHAINLQV
jgi:hypothetical protein